jgi:hypothetical protein
LSPPRHPDSAPSGPQSSLLLDLPSDSSVPLALDLQADMGRMFRQLGIESFRASVVDIGVMDYHDLWTISDDGSFSQDESDRPLESAFPGAMAIITQLSQVAPEDTVTQRLSPRHWVFGWRVDGVNAVLAEARYRDARGSVTAVDASTVRLVCDIAMRARQPAPRSSAQAPASVRWPATGGVRPKRVALALQLGLPLSLASALLAVWLAVVQAPEIQRQASAQRAETERLHGVLDQTMARALASALATGDYGEVQTALSSFETLGYFKAAAVVNAQQRVVSASGSAEGLRIGDALPATLTANARSLPLTLGSQPYGQLVVLRPTDGAAAAGDPAMGQTIRWLALGTALASAIVAGLLARRWWRTQRNLAG